jgi:uncharacterized protein (DUF1501 family)
MRWRALVKKAQALGAVTEALPDWRLDGVSVRRGRRRLVCTVERGNVDGAGISLVETDEAGRSLRQSGTVHHVPDALTWLLPTQYPSDGVRWVEVGYPVDAYGRVSPVYCLEGGAGGDRPLPWCPMTEGLLSGDVPAGVFLDWLTDVEGIQW